MKHNYDETQLTEAYKAALKEGSCGDTAADYMSAFLDALPEPVSDDWQECGFEDIRKGDRFKVEGRGWHYESTATHIYVDVVCVNPRTGSFITRDEVGQMDEITLYRIPAPVQHPDPAEHPVILVTEYDIAGNIMECEPTPFFAHDGVYKNDIYAHRPDDVLSWTPGKVVEDDR